MTPGADLLTRPLSSVFAFPGRGVDGPVPLGRGLGRRTPAALDRHRAPVYALGERYVLCVPKDHPEAIADTYTGSVAAPVAHAAGVRTPALVVFDD